jgi:hypothetical protein
MHALDATADQITSVDWRRSKWHCGPLGAVGHKHPMLRGKLPLAGVCAMYSINIPCSMGC